MVTKEALLMQLFNSSWHPKGVNEKGSNQAIPTELCDCRASFMPFGYSQ